ncbi:unnamed protein product [Euphydryas editha]|uniref:Serpin domain-containing protein n=1 Tax=Euphydryas editha TaxID=104508 RepID=A0AAU9UFB5_EUPED|nr:unnamed protein product [Euphydryas editha]
MIPIIFWFFILECNALDVLRLGRSEFSIELMKSTGLDNAIMAPFTVWALVASIGFWTKGEFQEQFITVLGLPRNKTVFLNEYLNLERAIFEKKSNSVNISSKIFIFSSTQCELYPEFKDTMTTYYGAVIETLNFEYNENSARKANDLIFKHVGSVFNLFQPEDFVNTTMIMSSALRFESRFKSMFRESETTIRNYRHNNNTYHVQIMRQTLMAPQSFMPSLNSDVIELALGDDGKFSLLLILPYYGTSLKDVYNKMNGVTLKYVFDTLQSDVDKFGLRNVTLKLPKVEIKTVIVLNKPLNDIGLKHLFGAEKSEFTGITSDDLYITSIDHTCEVVIKESGVYAFASTPGYRDYNIFGTDLEVKRPFIFFVMEKPTQTIILSGLYSKHRYILN